MKETMIQKNDDEKTTTQPKRERERESVLRTRVIITPIIAIHISHIKKEKNLLKTLHTNFKIHTNTLCAREKKTPHQNTLSLSLSDGIFTEGPNVSSS
jgi:hypothetical protein